jgi:hypothetical protein
MERVWTDLHLHLQANPALVLNSSRLRLRHAASGSTAAPLARCPGRCRCPAASSARSAWSRCRCPAASASGSWSGCRRLPPPVRLVRVRRLPPVRSPGCRRLRLRVHLVRGALPSAFWVCFWSGGAAASAPVHLVRGAATCLRVRLVRGAAASASRVRVGVRRLPVRLVGVLLSTSLGPLGPGCRRLRLRVRLVPGLPRLRRPRRAESGHRRSTSGRLPGAHWRAGARFPGCGGSPSDLPGRRRGGGRARGPGAWQAAGMSFPVPTPDDERNHEPGPELLWQESYYLDFVSPDGEVGGRVSGRTNLASGTGRAWSARTVRW